MEENANQIEPVAAADSTNCSVLVNDDNLSTVALDVSMMEVLKDRNLRGDEKWFMYYKTLERYLYKRDPTFEPCQFTFDVQQDNNGRLVYIIKPAKKKPKPLYKRLLKFAPGILGPLCGAALTALLKS